MTTEQYHSFLHLEVGTDVVDTTLAYNESKIYDDSSGTEIGTEDYIPKY